MGWFDDQGIAGYTPYEQGGITGGQQAPGGLGAYTGGQQGGPMSIEGPGPMTNQSVGHDGTTAGGMTRDQYRDAWQSSGARSMDDLNKFIQANGGTIQSGNGTVMTPFGESIDMLQGARTNGNGSAAWGGMGGGAPAQGGPMELAGPGPMTFASGGGSGFGGAFGGGGSAAGPGGGPGGWDGKTFSATPIAYGGDYNPQNIARPGALTAERFNAPDPFRATTAEDMKADPGYQFRMQQGAEALQASKAASGMLRSGNTLTALNDYAQGMGSQEFANVDARRKGEYQNAFGNALATNQTNNQSAANAYGLTNQYQGQSDQFNAARQDAAHQNNFANRFGVDQANAQNAQQAWSGNVGAQLGQGNLALGNKQADNSYSLGRGQLDLGRYTADQSYDLGRRSNDLGYYSAGNSYSLGRGNLDLGWAGHDLAAQGQNFQQGYSLANMGLSAAGQQGNFGGQYAGAAGGYATGAGNATAAGQVGAGNAWANAFNNAGNGAMDMAMYYGLNKQGGGGGQRGGTTGVAAYGAYGG